MEDRQQRARDILQQSEHHFSEMNRHQCLGAKLYNEYRDLMREFWDGSTIGEGDGG